MDPERVAGRKDEERLGGVRKAEKLETKLQGKDSETKAAGSRKNQKQNLCCGLSSSPGHLPRTASRGLSHLTQLIRIF